MTNEEVIKEFCELSTEVMDKIFDCRIPADCFCKMRIRGNDFFGYQFADEIMEFIQAAVQEKIEREGK